MTYNYGLWIQVLNDQKLIKAYTELQTDDNYENAQCRTTMT